MDILSIVILVTLSPLITVYAVVRNAYLLLCFMFERRKLAHLISLKDPLRNAFTDEGIIHEQSYNCSRANNQHIDYFVKMNMDLNSYDVMPRVSYGGYFAHGMFIDYIVPFASCV